MTWFLRQTPSFIIMSAICFVLWQKIERGDAKLEAKLEACESEKEKCQEEKTRAMIEVESLKTEIYFLSKK